MPIYDRDDPLRVWEVEDYKLCLWDYGRYCCYEFSYRSTVVFEGCDFRPSPLYAIDSDEAMGALLGFLSCQPGDVDTEYFESYAEDQLTFIIEHGETLSLYAMELEDQ